MSGLRFIEDEWLRDEVRCPHGCGSTLFVGAGGWVTCSFIKCPSPDVHDLVAGDVPIRFRAHASSTEKTR